MRNVIKIIGCLCSLMFFAFILNCNVINSAQADVCFLPEGEGCNQVPYNEGCEGGNCAEPTPDPDPNEACNASSYCYATEEEAKNARGATFTNTSHVRYISQTLDSYKHEGNCYCLKNSCGFSSSRSLTANIVNLGYYLSESKGEGWTCSKCQDEHSILHNNYKCTEKQCTSPATISCVAEDECHKCAPTGAYSGDNVCEELQAVEPSCPQKYSKEVPSSLCYDTVDMTCGNEGDKCYKTIDEPNCGANKRVSSANGVCSCTCADGYHPDGDECVLNTCTTGEAETSCTNDETFNPNGTSFEDTSGATVRCGECVKEQECTYTYKELTYNEIISYAHGSRPILWCGVRTNNGFTGGIELMNEIYKLEKYASLSQFMGVDSYMRYVDKISESSNSCIRDGVEYFETVCEGTPAHRCRGTYQTFTPKCKSRGYVITPKGNTDDCESTASAPESPEAATSAAHIWSEEYGDCVKDCPKLGVSYYNNKNECENANSGKKCSQKDQCYRTCEDLNKYSNDCGDNCVYEASSGCYVRNTFTIEKGNEYRGCCSNNVYNYNCLGWYVVLESESTMSSITIERGSGEVPAGSYRICVARRTANPPQGSHSINLSGWSIDSTVKVELGYTGGIDYTLCTKDKVNLPAGGHMKITPSSITQTCTGTGSSGKIITKE